MIGGTAAGTRSAGTRSGGTRSPRPGVIYWGPEDPRIKCRVKGSFFTFTRGSQFDGKMASIQSSDIMWYLNTTVDRTWDIDITDITVILELQQNLVSQVLEPTGGGGRWLCAPAGLWTQEVILIPANFEVQHSKPLQLGFRTKFSNRCEDSVNLEDPKIYLRGIWLLSEVHLWLKQVNRPGIEV